MLLEMELIPSDASLLRGDIPRDAAYEVDGLLSLSAESIPFDVVPTQSDIT